MLSWILSGSIASKHIFARNRLRDVLQMSGELEIHFALSPSFKYVLTIHNPTDLTTIGLSLRRFKSDLKF